MYVIALSISQTENLLGKLSVISSAVKSKSADMKEKLTSYMKNEFPPEERSVHVVSNCAPLPSWMYARAIT